MKKIRDVFMVWIIALLISGLVLPIPVIAEEVRRPTRNNTGVIGDGTRNYRIGGFNRLIFQEVSAPSGDPSANTGWLYVKDSGGLSALYFENDAGSVTQLGPSGAFGSGLTVTGGAVNLNANSNYDVNLATGTSTGTTTIGNSTSILTIAGIISGATPLVFEGATADAYELTIGITDPKSDTTITFPDAPASSDVPVVLAADAATTSQVGAGTSTVTNSSIAVPAGHAAAGHVYRWRAAGTKTGANAAMIVHCNLYGIQVMSLTASDAAAADWIADIYVHVLGTASQRIMGTLMVNGKASVVDYATAVVDISGAGNVYLQIQSQNAGDTVTADITTVHFNK